MSYDDGNELLDVQLFGLNFKATHAEQRALWMKLSTSSQSREWGICRNLMNIVMAPAPMPVHVELAERMENADTAMTKLASRLIEEMLAARQVGS